MPDLPPGSWSIVDCDVYWCQDRRILVSIVDPKEYCYQNPRRPNLLVNAKVLVSVARFQGARLAAQQRVNAICPGILAT